MPRARIVALCFVLSWQAAAVDETEAASKRKTFAKRMVGKGALIRTGAATGFSYIAGTPREWGRGAAGLGKRFASSMGRRAVSTSVEMGVAAWRHEDLSFRPSGQTGFRRRMKHALLSTVVARKKTTGDPTVASGRISGAFASGFVSRLWQPARLRTVSSGGASSGIAMGANAGANAVREFWP